MSHGIYLLDAFNVVPDVSNWVTAGNAMNTLASKGVSVVAPASKGLAAGGHGIVAAPQGGTGA